MGTTTRAAISSSVALASLLTVARDARAGIAVGAEFQVNTQTVDLQNEPAAGMDADGDFVVVWKSAGQDGADTGIFARRYSSAGAALAAEFQVNAYTESDQEHPAVAVNPAGDFLVVWASYLQDGSSRGIFGRHFSSSGAAVGLEFMVNSRTTSSQNNPAVAMNDGGDFVVTWFSFQDGGSYGVFGSRFSSAGGLLGVEFQVNSYTTVNQILPSVAIGPAGEFVIAWGSFGQDGSSFGIFAQRFASGGAAEGVEFQVNVYTEGSQYVPAVAMSPDGAFVIAWHSPQDGSGRGVFARRFDGSGTGIGTEFQVNLYTSMEQTQAQIAMDEGGDFVITWHSQSDGSLYGTFGRRFTRTGAALGGEFQLNTRTALPQIEPSPAMDAHGGFVVAWTSVQQDGPEVGNQGIFAQRFHAPLLDVDGDGAAEALSDGLLVLRHFFGFNGATLVSGAVDLVDCTRCTPEQIESYLAVLGLLLDIDGDGENDPLTDGLLTLRDLFGFTGAALIGGAVDGVNCSRCTDGPIAAYLETLGG